MSKLSECYNHGCSEHKKMEDDYICIECGFNPEEAARRKKLIQEKGLTPDRWGARRLKV